MQSPQEVQEAATEVIEGPSLSKGPGKSTWPSGKSLSLTSQGVLRPPPSSSWYRGITVQVPSVGLKVYEGNCSWPRWRGVRTKAGFFLQGGGPSEGSGHRWRGLFLDWFPQLLALFRAFSRRKYSPLSWILQLALRCIHLRRAPHVLKHHSSS